MSEKRLEPRFDQFMREIILGDPTPVQRDHLRVAFFWGAEAMHRVVSSLGPSAGMSVEDSLQVLDEVIEELRAFREEIVGQIPAVGSA